MDDSVPAALRDRPPTWTALRDFTTSRGPRTAPVPGRRALVLVNPPTGMIPRVVPQPRRRDASRPMPGPALGSAARRMMLHGRRTSPRNAHPRALV